MKGYIDDSCKYTITELSKHVKYIWNKIIVLLQEKNQDLPSNFKIKMFIFLCSKMFQKNGRCVHYVVGVYITLFIC